MLPKWKHRKTMLVLSFLMVSLYDMNEREVRSMALNDNIKSEKKKNIHNNNLPINCTYHDKLYADGRTVQDVQI